MDENNFTLFFCHIILYFKYISFRFTCFRCNGLFGNISYNNNFLDSYSNTMVFFLFCVCSIFWWQFITISDFFTVYWCCLSISLDECLLNVSKYVALYVNLIYWLLLKVGSVVRVKCVKTSPCMCFAKWAI